MQMPSTARPRLAGHERADAAAASPQDLQARAARRRFGSVVAASFAARRTRRSGSRKSLAVRKRDEQVAVAAGRRSVLAGGIVPSAARAASSRAARLAAECGGVRAPIRRVPRCRSSRRAQSSAMSASRRYTARKGRAARAERMDAPYGETQQHRERTADEIDAEKRHAAEDTVHRPVDHDDARRRRENRHLRSRRAPDAAERAERRKDQHRRVAGEYGASAGSVSGQTTAERGQQREADIDAKRVRFEPAASARQVQNAPIAAHEKSGSCSHVAERSIDVDAHAARKPSDRLASPRNSDTIHDGRRRASAASNADHALAWRPVMAVDQTRKSSKRRMNVGSRKRADVASRERTAGLATDFSRT